MKSCWKEELKYGAQLSESEKKHTHDRGEKRGDITERSVDNPWEDRLFLQGEFHEKVQEYCVSLLALSNLYLTDLSADNE